MNILREVERNFNCDLNLVWTVDPFATILQNLKPEENYVFRSPAFQLWFGEQWEVQLQFVFHGPLFQTTSTVILVNLSQEKPEPHSSKGTYSFSVSVITSIDNEVELHNSSELKSKGSWPKSTPWLMTEPVKFRIQARFCAFKNNSLAKAFNFNLGERLYAIKETEPLCDFTIVVEGRELKANKAVLALASPVFSAMFNYDFTEKQTQSVRIEDTDVETVEKFLHFAYTGRSPEFTDIKPAIKLLNMSEKYQVTVLKEECMTYIESAIPDAKERASIIALLKIAV